ncbi:hypothetical protein YC2023_018275 [Brassica napus]
MVKPRLCPKQDQSSPLQSCRQLGFGQVFSDQLAAYRQRTLVPSDLVPGGFKETPYSLDREDSDRRGHGLWLSDYTTDCGLSRGDPKDSGPRSVESSFFWPLWFLHIRTELTHIRKNPT